MRPARVTAVSPLQGQLGYPVCTGPRPVSRLPHDRRRRGSTLRWAIHGHLPPRRFRRCVAVATPRIRCPLSPPLMEACVRCHPFWSTVCVAGLFSQARRSLLLPSSFLKSTATCPMPLEPPSAAEARFSQLFCHFMTAGRCLCGDPGRCGPGKRPGALPARLGRLGWLTRSHRQHSGCQGHNLGLVPAVYAPLTIF